MDGLEVIINGMLTVGGIVLAFLLKSARDTVKEQSAEITKTKERLHQVELNQAGNHFTKAEVMQAITAAVTAGMGPIQAQLAQVQTDISRMMAASTVRPRRQHVDDGN